MYLFVLLNSIYSYHTSHSFTITNIIDYTRTENLENIYLRRLIYYAKDSLYAT